MNDFSRIPIIQCTYQLSLDLQRLTPLLPRPVRYLTGKEILDIAGSLLDFLVVANQKPSDGGRLLQLDNAVSKLTSLRLRLRMLKDLHHISIGQTAHLNAQIEIISRQLSAWRKWVANGATQDAAAAPDSCVETH